MGSGKVTLAFLILRIIGLYRKPKYSQLAFLQFRTLSQFAVDA